MRATGADSCQILFCIINKFLLDSIEMLDLFKNIYLIRSYQEQKSPNSICSHEGMAKNGVYQC